MSGEKSEQTYISLRNVQRSLENKFIDLQAGFVKSNTDRRRKIAKETQLQAKTIKFDFKNNENLLQKLNDNSTFSSRSYFKETEGEKFLLKFEEFIDNLQKYLDEEDTEDEEESEAGKMDEIKEILKQLAEMQLQQQQRGFDGAGGGLQGRPRQESLGDVLRRASSGILEFKKNNITNFLNSVQTHYDATETAVHKLQVLRVAQQKVVGSALIENTEYETFDRFKSDVIANFKPTKSFTQLEVEMATLFKGKAETVDQLAKRALNLKVDYELAYKSELISMNSDLDAVRLIEVERKAVNSFRNAMPQGILVLMGAPKDTLNAEINSATAAEANQLQRQRNVAFANDGAGTSKDSKANKASPDKSTGFRKNPVNKEKSERSPKTGKEKKDVTCHKCQKKGHYANECRSSAPPVDDKPPVSVAHARSSSKDEPKEKKNSKNEAGADASVSARSLKARSTRQ